MWHHQHTYETIESRVFMTDIVIHLPLVGIMGTSVNSLWIRIRRAQVVDYDTVALVRVCGRIMA